MSLIVCDSSSLISLSDTCNVDVLRFLRSRGGEFAIPPAVEEEIVEHPAQLKQYAFSAVRLRKLVDDGVVRASAPARLASEKQAIESAANAVMLVDGKPLRLIHGGEAECLALLRISQAIQKTLLVDEKTTRLLLESPKTLCERLRGEYKASVEIDEAQMRVFRAGLERVTVIRSTELVAVAASLGFFADYGGAAGDAARTALGALQLAGCSVSSDELRDYDKIV
jgi:predicted nucleic acid-binding protein